MQNLLAGGRVEVVGRLIQQQHVRARGHERRQGETGLLATGENAGRLIHVIPREEEGTQNRAHSGVIQVGRRGLHVLEYGPVAIQNLVLLGKVSQLRAVTVDDLAGIGLRRAGKHAQQRGLTRTVQAQHHHTGAAVDGQVNARENLERAVRLRQTLRRKRGLAAGGRIRETDCRHLVHLTLLLQAAQKLLGTLNHLLSGSGLRGLGSHLIRLLHEGARLLLGVGALALAAVFVLLALGQVVLPAHVVLVNHAAVGVQVKDAVDDELHEVHVVADDQQAAREVLEEVP